MFTGTLHSIFKEPNEIEDNEMTIENTLPDTIFQWNYLFSSLKTPDQTKEHEILELYFLNKTKHVKISRLLKISRSQDLKISRSQDRECIKLSFL